MEIVHHYLHGLCSMSASLEGFITLAKQKNPGIVFAHCFLHREALISKSIVPEFQKLLDETINRVGVFSHHLT
jgi:hypothetical protein